jgi:hypothetical protein
MKTALLVGCGSKFGLTLLQQLLTAGWRVYSISGSDVEHPGDLHHLTIDWHTVTVADLESFLRTVPELDLIFFNQNASALAGTNFSVDTYKTVELWRQEKDWAQSYFVSCILPFHIVHALGSRCSDRTKVAWMLSSYIYKHPDISNADYVGNKYQNYLIMRNFSKHHPACSFGVNPDNLASNQNINSLVSILTSDSCNLSGSVVKFDGSTDTNFAVFN